MIISHKHKFIFIHSPKTAGISIKKYLAQYCGEEDIITPNSVTEGQNYRGLFNPLPELIDLLKNSNGLNPAGNPDFKNLGMCKEIVKQFLNKKKFYSHIPAVLIRSRLPQEVWNNYFKFCVERNPFDKVVSKYYFRRKNLGDLSYSFDDFMNDKVHYRLPYGYPLYCDLEGNVIVDRVLRYESLQQEFMEVLDYLELPKENLPLENVSNRPSYREFFANGNEKYIPFIRNAFKRELEVHNYEY